MHRYDSVVAGGDMHVPMMGEEELVGKTYVTGTLWVSNAHARGAAAVRSAMSKVKVMLVPPLGGPLVTLGAARDKK